MVMAGKDVLWKCIKCSSASSHTQQTATTTDRNRHDGGLMRARGGFVQRLALTMSLLSELVKPESRLGGGVGLCSWMRT